MSDDGCPMPLIKVPSFNVILLAEKKQNTMKPSSTTPLNDKRTIFGWVIFDWANSSYALVITAAIFPAYFAAVTDELISLGSIEIYSSTLYSFCISLAYLVMAMISPVLSGIADYGGRKKTFLRFFTTIGSLACIALFFFKGMDQLAIGTIGFILATIGFSGGLVFYNSYLPEIVSEDQYDSVSARGFAYGYVGSVLLLIINLLVITYHESLGIDKGLATRLSFVMVGLWWIGFAQITFRRLPEDVRNRSTENLFSKGFDEIKMVWNKVKREGNIKRFLFGFFSYSAGAQTVIFLASTFAEKELHFEVNQLIVTILLLQIVAIGGAYLFAKISDRKGNIFSLVIILCIWVVICLLAYFVTRTMQFYFLASLVGLVMGGVQSLSRSTYSKLIPEETKDTTSFFSFYDVLEKVAIVTGTFSFGIIEQITGSLRYSVLALTIFFIVGILLVLKVKLRKVAM